jgi:phosphate transport system substrate-binding protein
LFKAISFFGYSYYFENQNSLSAVAIRNDAGEYLTPDPITISDGSYNPLARRIYMNLLNDDAALANTAPFVKFGLENPEMVSSTGYVAIPEDQAAELINTRLSGGSTSDSSNNGAFKLSISTIVGMVLGSAAFLL